MNCRICGKRVEFKYMEKVNQQMRENESCFTCWFWTEKARKAHLYIRIKGECYRIGPDNMPMKGHGGAKFKIRFKTGETIETNNLWHQGIIPDAFKMYLPDNADFVTE